jgi:hypothetical protein
MHHHRPPLPPPAQRRPALDRALSTLAAIGLGVLLAMCLVHWASCEGVC